MLLTVALGFNGICEAYAYAQTKSQSGLRKVMLVNSGVYMILCFYLCGRY